MNYLLDTHVLLWWLEDPKKLSKKAESTLSDRQNQIFVSSVSFWEIGIKARIGRIRIPNNFIKLLEYESINVLPILAQDGLAVADLPVHHTDPFDRMLIIQAKHNDLTLITRDKHIIKYPVTTLKA